MLEAIVFIVLGILALLLVNEIIKFFSNSGTPVEKQKDILAPPGTVAAAKTIHDKVDSQFVKDICKTINQQGIKEIEQITIPETDKAIAKFNLSNRLSKILSIITTAIWKNIKEKFKIK